MNLASLINRCQTFVLGQLELLFKGRSLNLDLPVHLPSNLQDLSVSQFLSILESDDLPVKNEQQVFQLTSSFLKDRHDLTPDSADALLLAIRWRLVPGVYIAEIVMDSPVVMDKPAGVRPRLLEAFADAMRFQILGGKARLILPEKPSGRLRKQQQISVPSYAFLAVGMRVRVVSDVDALRHLCRRCAPGARLKVEWVSEMKMLAGITCNVKSLRDEICGIQLEDPSDSKMDRFLPFDALLLA
eukprot:TRINITY_DN32755_c0_g2_i1.p1 TRINITY_DN32755_c0_g2~~TRINITY_DN32755_c0_g2_i1.p1  ORF type:complete len:243 (-),score=50.73 TRINITY_DN32755_c0_g2_i1:49-777(-)